MSDSNTYLDLADRIADSFAEIENDITVDLRKGNEEYYSLYQSISELKAKHPFIQDVIEGDGRAFPIGRRTRHFNEIFQTAIPARKYGAAAHLFQRTYRQRFLSEKG